MARVKQSVVLLGVMLWHAAAPVFVSFLPASVAHGAVIMAARDARQSTWVSNTAGTVELVNAIRGNQLRLHKMHRPVAWYDEAPPRQVPRQVVKAHRVPYPTRHELRLRFSRSENGDLPH
jgi:hypothetical protein